MASVPYSVLPYCAGHRPRFVRGCEACRANQVIRGRERRAATARVVEAGPVREHIGLLRRAGLTPDRIAAASGASTRAIAAIWSGETARPTRTLAELILAVPVPAPAPLSLEGVETRQGGGQAAGRTLVRVMPARQYAIILREQGMEPAAIASAASAILRARADCPCGIASRNMIRVIRGEQHWWMVEHARAVLDVELPALPMLPVGMVHIHGTRRRIQGLAVDGFGLTLISRALGVSRPYVQRIASGRMRWINADRAAAVARLADELAATPLPQGPAAELVRGRAARHSWFPLDAWTDEAVDDPYGLPVLIDEAWVDPVAVGFATSGRIAVDRLTGAERVEAVRVLARLGLHDEEIARRLQWAPHRADAGLPALTNYRVYHSIPSSTGEAIDDEVTARRRKARGKAGEQQRGAVAA